MLSACTNGTLAVNRTFGFGFDPKNNSHSTIPSIRATKNAIMPLEPPDQHHWKAAVGYVELGMYESANAELEKIDAFCRAAPEVLAVRVPIYHGLKKWELMQIVARKLAEYQPDNYQWKICDALATRQAQSVQAAKKILLSADKLHPRQPRILVNLACYCSQLNEIELAKGYLNQAMKINPNSPDLILEKLLLESV
jgi:tetratricopeptide (TPR) repeat protein